jgi:hypothetical protein
VELSCAAGSFHVPTLRGDPQLVDRSGCKGAGPTQRPGDPAIEAAANARRSIGKRPTVQHALPVVREPEKHLISAGDQMVQPDIKFVEVVSSGGLLQKIAGEARRVRVRVVTNNFHARRVEQGCRDQISWNRISNGPPIR